MTLIQRNWLQRAGFFAAGAIIGILFGLYEAAPTIGSHIGFAIFGGFVTFALSFGFDKEA